MYVEGRLKSDTWTGQDGQTRFTNEINAFDVRFLGGGAGMGPGGEEDFADERPRRDADSLPW